MPFSRYTVRTDPFPIPQLIPSLKENLPKRTLVRSRHEKEVYGLIESRTCSLQRLPASHDVKRHGVGDKLIAFTPNLNCVLDVHRRYHITAGLSKPRDHARALARDADRKPGGPRYLAVRRAAKLH